MQDDPFARAVQRAESAEQAKKARKRNRVEDGLSDLSRTLFRTHASVFVAVNLLLVAIWATTTPGYPWFLWPLLGWGIGLVAHYAAVKDHLGGSRSRGRDRDPGFLPTPAPAPAYAPPATPAPAPAYVPPSAPAAAAPTPREATPSTVQELASLAELHRSGALSDDEFSAAKAKLLG